MSRQIVFYVEGPTEREFVREILGPHLTRLGLVWHGPILVANSVRKDRVARGGVRKYGPIRRDLDRLLKQFRGADFVFTTLLDYYGLPDDFPGKASPPPGAHTALERARAIEAAWKEDLGDRRFAPHLVLHEFEALILVKPDSLLRAYPAA